MSDLKLGVIGNCTTGALVDAQGRICWACFPRFDADPLFNSLLQDADLPPHRFEDGPEEAERGGFFDVLIENYQRSEQSYVPNTAILKTKLFDKNGGAIEITDFMPRFKDRGRMFRPLMLVRHVRPISGSPRIRVRLRPTHSYNAAKPELTRGSNHIRYVSPHIVLRLTTDAPVSYIVDETPFVLEDPLNMMLGADESLSTALQATSHSFYQQTAEYWSEWVRFLAIPFEWQDAVIRSAITLKLCAYEESGALIAALTTSIPEAAGTQRNWDYRFCWLRDAYFVVQTLNRLGATKTMEDHIRYITNVVVSAKDGKLQPVYGVALEKALVEEFVPTLDGYRGMGPVRRGNQAYEHIQNDVYGSVILACTHAFFDRRLTRVADTALFRRLEAVGYRCLELYNQPDAGLWELRTMARVHTYSAVMCWAGVDRLARIATHLHETYKVEGMDQRAGFWREKASQMQAEIIAEAYDAKRNTFVESYGGDALDASLLLIAELGFVAAEDDRFVGTVDAIGEALQRGQYLFRYAIADDFGTPENAFNICTFWYIDALALIGRTEEARELFENMLACRNPLGLLSEDLNPTTGELWGNFPQTYSLVGLINSASLLSKKWRDAF